MSLAACAALVERGDPDRFLSAMAAPVAARAVLLPIYAFNIEVARAPWVSEEAAIAEIRLQWWRDALSEIAGGARPRRHEVVEPLAGVIGPGEAELLDGLVAARRWDIYREPFDDAAHFERHINATSGTLFWVVSQALGATTGEAAVRDLGYAAGVAAWLRAVPDLEARGRIPLLDGTPDGVRNLARGALQRYRMARSARRDIDPAALPALRAGWQTRAILKQAIAASERVGEGRLGVSDFRRKGSLLFCSLTGRW